MVECYGAMVNMSIGNIKNNRFVIFPTSIPNALGFNRGIRAYLYKFWGDVY